MDAQGNIIGTVAVGSGFIIDSRGYIVTNEHVIHEVGQAHSRAGNGEERPATLVSHDAPFTDLAVIKMPAGRPAGALRWEDSEPPGAGPAGHCNRHGAVRISQQCYRRGRKRPEPALAARGRVHGGPHPDRRPAQLRQQRRPAVTLDGEVVGINSTVVRTLGGTENVHGVAFAISSRTLPSRSSRASSTRALIARPYFGIDHQNIDQELLLTTNLRIDHGAIVQRVTGGSPAAQAGIQAGDVLLRLGRNDIAEEMPFINALSQRRPNDRVEVQVWRDGRVFNTQVQVQPR